MIERRAFPPTTNQLIYRIDRISSFLYPVYIGYLCCIFKLEDEEKLFLIFTLCSREESRKNGLTVLTTGLAVLQYYARFCLMTTMVKQVQIYMKVAITLALRLIEINIWCSVFHPYPKSIFFFTVHIYIPSESEISAYPYKGSRKKSYFLVVGPLRGGG